MNLGGADITDTEVLQIEDDVIAPALATPRLSIPDAQAAAIVSDLSVQVAFAASQQVINALCGGYV